MFGRSAEPPSCPPRFAMPGDVDDVRERKGGREREREREKEKESNCLYRTIWTSRWASLLKRVHDQRKIRKRRRFHPYPVMKESKLREKRGKEEEMRWKMIVDE